MFTPTDTYHPMAFFRMALTRAPGRRMPYRCSECGCIGHNARTCGKAAERQAVVEARAARKRRGAYTCSVCGEKGHNARTCPKRAEAAEPTALAA